MWRSLCLLALLVLSGGAHGAEAPAKPLRILFVGNSLTYKNDLPAIFVALAAAQGKPVQAQMLVRGGQTLTGHLAGGLITPKLLSGFDKVVLQERGGDLVCLEYNQKAIDDCRHSHEAHAQLVRMARAAGAEPILLGTYQLGPASRAIDEGEADVAHEVGIARVPVSEPLRAAMARRPDAAWIAADGQHPGDDLSMLMAAGLYRAVYGELPKAVEVEVKGDTYIDHANFSGTEVLPEPRSQATRSFGAARMAALLRDVGIQ